MFLLSVVHQQVFSFLFRPRVFYFMGIYDILKKKANKKKGHLPL